jgi:hypothetical protein
MKPPRRHEGSWRLRSRLSMIPSKDKLMICLPFSGNSSTHLQDG